MKKRTTIYIDSELLKKLKKLAIDEEKRVSEILEELIRKRLSKQ